MKPLIKFDFILLITVLLLAVIGTSMIYSASSFKANERFGDSNYFLKRQLVRVIFGIVLMTILYHIDYHDLQKLSWLFFLIALVFLIYVLLNGVKVNGSRRSFFLINFMFQPSEAAKVALILFLSNFLAKKGERIREFNNGLLPALFIIAITMIPILLEPDLGTSIIIFAIACAMLFVSGAHLYHLAALGISSLAVVSVLLTNFSYQKSRLFQFFGTIRGLREPTWQVVQSLICFANGGFGGVGLGNSRQKLHFLPQPFTDFIYSIVAEEAGVFGSIFVLLLFLVFLWRGIWIALHAPDRAGKLLAVGITASIIIYAFASVAIVSNLLPITGIPMPFISYGGSALIFNFIAVGMLLNISSQVKRQPRALHANVGDYTMSMYRIKSVRKRKFSKRT